MCLRYVLEFVTGTGDLRQAASATGHIAVTVGNLAVAVVAAAGEAAMRRSQASLQVSHETDAL